MTKYGIQMYSLRDITRDNMQKALESVAKMGYKYIEFAGFFNYTSEQIKGWLDEYGLECSSTHTGMDGIAPENIDETIRFHKAIGCDRLIVPGCDWSTKEKADSVIDALNFAHKKLSENGIKLGYHNHSREFFPTKDGIVFEDEIIKRTEAEIEVDTFWLFNAGMDVFDFLEKNKKRISVIHLKDGIPSAAKNKNYNHVHDGVTGLSLGQGKAPVAEVCKWALENNILMVVESEGLNPTGEEEVSRCIEYLKSLEK